MRRLVSFALAATLLAGALPARAQSSDVATTWRRRCAMCHGADGRGQTYMGKQYGIPDLTTPTWQSARSDEQIRGVILQGKGRMPAFQGKLSRPEVDALVQYLRAMKSAK